MDGLYRYDFEKPIAELVHRLKELRKDSQREQSPALIQNLEGQLATLKQTIYGTLTAWQRVQLARHPLRPFTLDYVQLMASDFVELHGDRLYGDDKALVGGFARIEQRKVLILGHQKGRDTKENLMRNFGSAHPEGYRKALRLMRLAAKAGVPILILIDTPGAYPGIGAEERGQAHSIAVNIREMARLATPIFVCVIGEGGSGGALGVGVGDRIVMLEHAYYSVISPEGCAAILWRDRARAPDAAEALKLTARDLLGLGLIDEIVPEPQGGAHHDPAMGARGVKAAFLQFMISVEGIAREELLQRRYERFRRIGHFTTAALASPTQPA